MTTTKKVLIKDQESCLIDESIDLLNQSLVPSYREMLVPHPSAGSYLTLFSLSKGGISIHRIDIAFETSGDIQTPPPPPFPGGSTLRFVWFDNGNLSGEMHLGIVRDFFDLNPIPAGAIVELSSLQARTVQGQFPMTLTAPCVGQLAMVNSESFDWTVRVTMWSRPTPYELSISPNYYNKMRNFFAFK